MNKTKLAGSIVAGLWAGLALSGAAVAGTSPRPEGGAYAQTQGAGASASAGAQVRGADGSAWIGVQPGNTAVVPPAPDANPGALIDEASGRVGAEIEGARTRAEDARDRAAARADELSRACNVKAHPKSREVAISCAADKKLPAKVVIVDSAPGQTDNTVGGTSDFGRIHETLTSARSDEREKGGSQDKRIILANTDVQAGEFGLDAKNAPFRSRVPAVLIGLMLAALAGAGRTYVRS